MHVAADGASALATRHLHSTGHRRMELPMRARLPRPLWFVLATAISVGRCDPEATPAQDAAVPGVSDGDPLPHAAIVRLGSHRYRLSNRIRDFAVSPDGEVIAATGVNGAFVL